MRDVQRASYRYTAHLQLQQACSSMARSLLLFRPYETKRFRGEDKEGGVADPRSLPESGSG